MSTASRTAAERVMCRTVHDGRDGQGPKLRVLHDAASCARSAKNERQQSTVTHRRYIQISFGRVEYRRNATDTPMCLCAFALCVGDAFVTSSYYNPFDHDRCTQRTGIDKYLNVHTLI